MSALQKFIFTIDPYDATDTHNELYAAYGKDANEVRDNLTSAVLVRIKEDQELNDLLNNITPEKYSEYNRRVEALGHFIHPKNTSMIPAYLFTPRAAHSYIPHMFDIKSVDDLFANVGQNQ